MYVYTCMYIYVYIFMYIYIYIYMQALGSRSPGAHKTCQQQHVLVRAFYRQVLLKPQLLPTHRQPEPRTNELGQMRWGGHALKRGGGMSRCSGCGLRLRRLESPQSCRRSRICRHLCSVYVSIRQHTTAYVSIRQHTSAYVSICQHTSAYTYVCTDSSEQPLRPVAQLPPHTHLCSVCACVCVDTDGYADVC